ncbi:unnamed protein product [Echinostoma caproni]|uniref:C2H2-type domain-containing protein n=1 Tax=Echinostoma caproni TaxID=27848 RepID=A0A183AMQ6_9TREM|nr:unnamed protein product [Echinostoma caproni]
MEPERAEPIPPRSVARRPSQDGSDSDASRKKTLSHRSRVSDMSKHSNISKSSDLTQKDMIYPDEYNLHDETKQPKLTSKGVREPKTFGSTSTGERRKRPDSQIHEHSQSTMQKEKKPARKPRHPSPPKPPEPRMESKGKGGRSKSRHQHGKPINGDLPLPYTEYNYRHGNYYNCRILYAAHSIREHSTAHRALKSAYGDGMISGATCISARICDIRRHLAPFLNDTGELRHNKTPQTERGPNVVGVRNKVWVCYDI